MYFSYICKFLSDKKQIKIITAWRYPAISPKRDRIPIPDEIIRELKYEKN